MTIFVPLLDPKEVPGLASWGVALGRALEEPVDLWISHPDIELADLGEWLARTPEAQEVPWDDSGGGGADGGRVSVRIHDPRVESEAGMTLSGTADSILSEISQRSVTHLLIGKHPETRRSALVRSLFERAPCRVILLRFADVDGLSCAKVLVPTAGGPPAGAALRIGSRLALAGGGVVTPLYVEPPFGGDANEVGEYVLQKILKEADLAPEDHIHPRVEVAREPSIGIARAVEGDTDLILLGASEAGAVRRSLFGTIPDRYLRGETLAAVGVVRERRPLATRLRARVESWLDLTIPQLSRDERVSLFEKIRRGSDWNFDFMTLIGLSTGIATLGLLQDSAAVVIGAMLVAPLMTPLLGSGLSVVQGNLPLFRSSVRAIVLGFILAVGVAWAIAYLVPTATLTDELVARAGPTVLDLVVALLSGFAAAYCLGRPDLSAALPGVAIAAALVPPIATVGSAIALEAWGTARGAALLFGTNVVAITLGAAMSLYGGGIRPRGQSEGQWARFVVVGLILISIPLAWLLTSRLGARHEPWIVVARDGVAAWGETRLERSRRVAGPVPTIQLWIEAPNPPTGRQVDALRTSIESSLGEAVQLRVSTILIVESAPPGDGA